MSRAEHGRNRGRQHVEDVLGHVTYMRREWWALHRSYAYWYECECGWIGDRFPMPTPARAAAERHVEEVTASSPS